VLDLFSRKIVGAAMSDRLQTDVVLKALNQALRHRKPNGELLHHSDRGCQYTSYDFRELAKNVGIKLSMSGSGNCYDNAVAESFFHTLKTEHIQFNHFETREEAVNSIFEYIEVFYNRQRRHSTLNYLSPMEFEKHWSMQQGVSFPGVH
jgi:putative transposase